MHDHLQYSPIAASLYATHPDTVLALRMCPVVWDHAVCCRSFSRRHIDIQHDTGKCMQVVHVCTEAEFVAFACDCCGGNRSSQTRSRRRSCLSLHAVVAPTLIMAVPASSFRYGMSASRGIKTGSGIPEWTASCVGISVTLFGDCPEGTAMRALYLALYWQLRAGPPPGNADQPALQPLVRNFQEHSRPVSLKVAPAASLILTLDCRSRPPQACIV